MRAVLPAVALTAAITLLGACGTTTTERVATGALGGAAAGALIDNSLTGAAVGAAAGAATGAVVDQARKDRGR